MIARFMAPILNFVFGCQSIVEELDSTRLHAVLRPHDQQAIPLDAALEQRRAMPQVMDGGPDVGTGRFLDQRGWILRGRSPKQRLDGRSDAVDNGSQIGRFVSLRLAQLIERSGDRPALRVPQHDRQPGLEPLGSELDAAHLGGRYDVARDADDEEIAEALPKHQLGGNARDGAAEHDREGLLPRAGAIRGPGNALDEAAISLAQARECFLRGDHCTRCSPRYASRPVAITNTSAAPKPQAAA